MMSGETMARPDRATLERCRAIPTSTWSDALDRLGVDGVIGGLSLRAGERFAGTALPVSQSVGPRGSANPADFGIDLILPATRPGDVIVIAQDGAPPASAIGGLAALAARQSGIVGIVIAGACRDLEELVAYGLPVMSRGVTPSSGRSRARILGVGDPVTIDGVDVTHGDLVVGDVTGAVVVPLARVEELLTLAEERATADSQLAERLVTGHT